jgi:hypothetical protein
VQLNSGPVGAYGGISGGDQRGESYSNQYGR